MNSYLNFFFIQGDSENSEESTSVPKQEKSRKRKASPTPNPDHSGVDTEPKQAKEAADDESGKAESDSLKAGSESAKEGECD